MPLVITARRGLAFDGLTFPSLTSREAELIMSTESQVSSRFLTSAIAALLTFIALSVTLLSKLPQVCLISARSSVAAVWPEG